MDRIIDANLVKYVAIVSQYIFKISQAPIENDADYRPLIRISLILLIHQPIEIKNAFSISFSAVVAA